MYIAKIVNNIFTFYSILIVLRIFLTWIPTIDWNQQPIKSVREVTDLYLNVFRRFIPPYGGLDFSPIIAIFVLQILQGLVVGVIANIFG